MGIAVMARFETLNQFSVRLADALVCHWDTQNPVPVEVHLNGKSGAGKSTLVARTASLLFNEYIAHGDFNHTTDYMNNNGIGVMSLDAGALIGTISIIAAKF